MMEQNHGEASLENVAEAVVRRKRGFSVVWFVPLVAALIAGWLIYKAVSEKGPVVTIWFESAEGLEAGKTKIKYKDVEVGTVDNIRLSDDLSHVVVTAECVREAQKYLLEDTKFWVVKARISASEVSGLGTLFSGVYIGMAPGRQGAPSVHFKGLEIPPVLTRSQSGGHFILNAEQLGFLDIGSPVYYRQIRVGKVVGYALGNKGQSVDIEVFVAAPYHGKVRKNTRFWNTSGLDVSFGANGIRVNTESFVSMIIGGIAFDSPPYSDSGEAATQSDTFALYPDKQAAIEKKYDYHITSLIYFDSSVRGLEVGAPVEFRGIKIGKVVDIKLEYHAETTDFKIPVLVETEPERFTMVGKGDEPLQNGEQIKDLVKKGLRAQLKADNLLTGQLIVDLNLYPNEPPSEILYAGQYQVIPSMPTPFEEITSSLTRFVDKLQALPLTEISKDLQLAVQGAKRLMNSSELADAVTALNLTLQETRRLADTLNKDLVPGVGIAVAKLESTLDSIEKILGNDSELILEAERAMNELAEASRTVRSLADYLERHPESLIRGKGSK